tara:strand:- start:73 stop:417 length:345 start_codon:yes stop_codon:yes gene_type:complete
MKTPTKFIQLVKEANEATDESSRLWLACKAERRAAFDAGKLDEYDSATAPASIAYSAHDRRAYAQIEGGKIICESTGSSNHGTQYGKVVFYFLKDGATQRNRFSRAKALEALQD